MCVLYILCIAKEHSVCCMTVQAQEQSVVRVKLCYLGSSTGGDGEKRRRKTRKTDSPLAEVIVQQQARGYTPIPVYRGQLRPGGKLYRARGYLYNYNT